MKSMIKKTTFREIKSSLGRYLAIFAIVALGVGFFAGLRVCQSAMLLTGQNYLDEKAFYDFRLLSTLGFEEKDVEAIANSEGIEAAVGSYSADVLFFGEDGSELVAKSHTITSGINEIDLKEGMMPTADDECLADVNMFTLNVGDVIYIAENNEESTRDLFAYKKYTVVGKIKSPLYLNYERGTTALGTGKVSGFLYFMPEGFNSEVYTEIYVRYSEQYDIYSDEYEAFADDKEEILEALTEERVNDRYQSILDEANTELEDAREELYSKKAEAEEELSDAEQEITDAEEEIKSGKKELVDKKDELTDAREELVAGIEQIDALPEMMQVQMAEQKTILEMQLAEVDDGLEQIAEKEKDLEEAKSEVENARKEYENAKLDFDTQIVDAEAELSDAEKEVAEIEEPDYYVLGRDTNIGYVCFESDTGIVQGISTVFPIFFFLVAALVCATTMNRMIEEQRTQIGVLKALGYSKTSIMGKYMTYSGSAAVLGCIVGFGMGCFIFPATIWKVYGIMYGFEDKIEYIFDWSLAIISLIAALVCSIGVTYLTCRYELSSVAAELIRPKSPKSGKRIFMEKIGFLWKRLSFLAKVSIRNVFRYKKRFYMMILGIGGCTALLVTGFGIKDSITDIVYQQFDGIQIYDTMITLEEELDEHELESFRKETEDLLEDYMMVLEESITVHSTDESAHLAGRDAYMVVPQIPESIEKYVLIHNSQGTPLAYPSKGEIILSEKLADKLSVRIGDTIMIQNLDMEEIELEVSGICQNFIYNYTYINSESYEELFGKNIEYTSFFANIQEGLDLEQTSAKLLNVENVISVTTNNLFRDRFSGMIASLDYIVLLIIVCAGALAFIVLYNLTNINITERIREIATIKVLGFYPKETGMYVLRENMVLSTMGSLIGLFLGIFLHRFVMYNIDIDAVSFAVKVLPLSFVYSFLLTLMFTIIVNTVMFFKLNHIQMAESLKSIE